MRTTLLFCIACLAFASAAAARQEPQADAPLVTVPRVERAPAIDGRIGEGEWQGSAVTCGFRDVATGLPARAPVVVSLCYDTQALYASFACSGEDPAKLAGGPGAHDSAMWSDSEAELFLAPEAWPLNRYAHFMVSHAGTFAEELIDGANRDLGWNGEWQCAAGRSGDGWTARMAIPWRTLGIEAPAPGARFRANFTRNAAGIQELSAWAPVRGGFHDPARFGTLVLGEQVAVSLTGLPGRATGPATVSARLAGALQVAMLKVELRAGARNRAWTRPFQVGRPGSLRFEVAGGASGLVVAVHETRGRLLWRQSVLLNLPDLDARVREAGDMLEDARHLPPLAPDLPELRARLAELEAEARQPLDSAGLTRVGDGIAAVEARIRDLARLAGQAGRGGAVPAYYLTNPATTDKILPNAADPGPQARGLRIAMARGEYEPVQVVVCAVRRGLRGVRVSVGELRGPGSALIPAGRVVVNPLGFVRCEKPTPGAPLAGEIPDVLLPDRAMDVPAGRRQPFFITVQTTAKDAPGTYRGTVRVTAEGDAPVTLPLAVRIYSLTLPVKSHLRTAFVLWGHYRPFLEAAGPDAYLGTYLRYAKVMLAHRISPITMWSPKKRPDGAWDFGDYDRYLSGLVPLGLTTLNIGGNGEVAGSRNADFVRAAADHLKARGWWDLHYVYGHDEASADRAEELRRDYSVLTEAVPDLKIMQTGWSPQPKLKGRIRIWCPLTAGADMKAIQAAQQEGDEVWWYVCCGPTAPYANLFVDYPGIQHRILGWQTFRHGITGFLYWGVDVWPGNTLPLKEYDAACYANWNPNSFGAFNGDGYLLYPGKGDQPVPSVRLALLRDGFEDYDLFTEAKALVDHSMAGGDSKIRLLVPAVRAARLQGLLAFPDAIGHLTGYTADGQMLAARREAILKTAEALARW